MRAVASCILAGFLAFAGTAWAGSDAGAGVKQSEAPVAPPPAPRPVEKPDPEKLKLAEQILDEAGAVLILDQISDEMLAVVTDLNKSKSSVLNKEQADRLSQYELEEIAAAQRKARSRIAPVYAQRFSVGELRAILDFYRSPVGRRFIAEQEAMKPVLRGAGQADGWNVTAEALKRLIADYPELEKTLFRP